MPSVKTLISGWLPWGKGPIPTRRDVSVADEEAANTRRHLLLDRTYEAAQEQERELREAADRIQAELDVLRRER